MSITHFNDDGKNFCSGARNLTSEKTKDWMRVTCKSCLKKRQGVANRTVYVMGDKVSRARC